MKKSKLLIYLVSFFFLFGQVPAYGQVITPFSTTPNFGSEFCVGKELGKPLITVNLINGVNRPGVYHVPVETNMAQLLAYAGGSQASADLEEIFIQRTDHKKIKVLTVDLDKILRSSSSVPSVEDMDIIHIPQKPSLDSTIKWVTLVSTLATIGLSVALIKQSED